MYKLLGILGGTFDPIHKGHIAIAEHVFQSLKMERMDFIPCNQSPHREQPVASAAHRLAMTQLAVQNHPAFHVNAIEIARGGVSYTVDTVKALSHIHPNHAICLLMGGDAFSKFHFWHEWETILEYAHIIVISREKSSATEIVSLVKRKTTDKNALVRQRAGLIYCENISPITISATQIREELKKGKSSLSSLSSSVTAYITKNTLYQQI